MWRPTYMTHTQLLVFNLWLIVAVLAIASPSPPLAASMSLHFNTLYHGYDLGNVPDPDTPTMTLKARPTTVHRPRSHALLQRARLRSLHSRECEIVEWDQKEAMGPDIEDRHTLSQLARMSGNAYALPDQSNWYEIDPAWNMVRLSAYCNIPS
jgi:lipase ATG15